VFTTYIPSLKVCNKKRFPFELNLKKLVDQFKDPKSHLIKYEGEETLPWTGSKDYYTFEASKEATHTIQQTFFFDENTKDMKFVELDGIPFISQIDSTEEKTFPDSTFEIPECDDEPVDSELPDNHVPTF
jgi:hypothetical protein